MGLEMKTPENCENSLRNRKKKENVEEKSEKSVKNSMEKVESEKVEQPQEENLKVKENTERKSPNEKENDTNGQFVGGDKNFRIRVEFDPMSIALFTLAVVTRFFKLSEPRNVV
jgi:HD-GYP domain-containing protein (c-di-GMP phosphodiesterase class II)